MHITIDEPAAHRLLQHGIRIGGHGVVAMHPETVLEGDTWLLGGIDNRIAGRFGAFSYSNSFLSPYVWSMGRYCSIASGVNFGDMEHAVDWASTSSFVYDRHFLWGEHTQRVGREYETRMLPVEAKRGGVHIGNDVWIGARAYIKAGVTLGDGCIIGTEAVVTKDVEPFMIVAGNPAKPIRRRLPEALCERLAASRWWDYEYTGFSGLDPADVERFVSGVETRKTEGLLRPIEPLETPLIAMISPSAA